MTAREVIRVLLHNGFREVRQVGAHKRFVRDLPPPQRHVTVSIHRGDVPKGTLRRIAEQAGKDRSEFGL